MTLPQVEPTIEVVAGWIVHANTLGSNYAHKAGALTAARENLGPKGFSLMLRKMKLESAEDVVEWLAK
jgi:hypothetical protein